MSRLNSFDFNKRGDASPTNRAKVFEGNCNADACVNIYIHVAVYARCLKIPQSHTVISTTFLIRRRIIAHLSGTIWTACMGGGGGVSVLH